MKTFEALVRVVHVETWTVEARNEAEARAKINEMDGEVDTDDTGGEVVDWEITSIKPTRA